MHKITDDFPRHLVIAFRRLEVLNLQITPCDYQLDEHGSSHALGFLPQMLEQLTSLTSLKLILETLERQQERVALLPPDLDDSCLSYSQVFPGRGRWPQLKWFYLRGLAIDGFGLWILVSGQMPQLQRLWLNRIDLLSGRWESIVEAMRREHPWELFSLQGQFRHQNREWWPCTRDKESQETLILDELMYYVSGGSRHPSLPPEWHDCQAWWYLEQMFRDAGEERSKAFWRRMQKLKFGWKR